MRHIAIVWNCDSDRYRELEGMNAERQKNFLLKHSLIHIFKTCGKIADVCEDFDHNGKSTPESEEALKIGAVKMFINALKLAEEAGLSAEDLLQRAPQFVK